MAGAAPGPARGPSPPPSGASRPLALGPSLAAAGPGAIPSPLDAYACVRYDFVPGGVRDAAAPARLVLDASGGVRLARAAGPGRPEVTFVGHTDEPAARGDVVDCVAVFARGVWTLHALGAGSAGVRLVKEGGGRAGGGGGGGGGGRGEAVVGLHGSGGSGGTAAPGAGGHLPLSAPAPSLDLDAELEAELEAQLAEEEGVAGGEGESLTGWGTRGDGEAAASAATAATAAAASTATAGTTTATAAGAAALRPVSVFAARPTAAAPSAGGTTAVLPPAPAAAPPPPTSDPLAAPSLPAAPTLNDWELEFMGGGG